MAAIIGMLSQKGIAGSLYTATPLRAFEIETGRQALVAYWDPLGLATSGNLAYFQERRAAKLQHGRVSMFTPIGHFLPEYC